MILRAGTRTLPRAALAIRRHAAGADGGDVNINASRDLNMQVARNMNVNIIGDNIENVAGKKDEKVVGDNTKTGKTINLN